MALLSTSAIRRAYGTPRGSPQVIRSRLPDGPRWSAGDALLARRGAVGRLLEDAAEDVLEVGVGARHHAAVQFAGTGGGVGLEHLGDRLEVQDDVVEAAL